MVGSVKLEVYEVNKCHIFFKHNFKCHVICHGHVTTALLIINPHTLSQTCRSIHHCVNGLYSVSGKVD